MAREADLCGIMLLLALLFRRLPLRNRAVLTLFLLDQEGKSLAGGLGSSFVACDCGFFRPCATVCTGAATLCPEAKGLPRYAYVAVLWSVPAVFSRQVGETCCLAAISACGCGATRT